MEAKFSIVQDHTDTFADSARLTVIGVGGGGGNAVETCQRPIKSSSVSKITTVAWAQVLIQK